MIVATRQEGKCRFWYACREPQSRRDFDCTRAAHVIYVLDHEIKLLFMPLWIAGFCANLLVTIVTDPTGIVGRCPRRVDAVEKIPKH
jgi:hypothetical protein